MPNQFVPRLQMWDTRRSHECLLEGPKEGDQPKDVRDIEHDSVDGTRLALSKRRTVPGTRNWVHGAVQFGKQDRPTDRLSWEISVRQNLHAKCQQ
jgi:hypothetical protein